ncbi:hypothetical protein [Rivularia sp. UHCC 0363]|uniref:hypothetical protein n=1 Tax=Rivularia sp. UHCC 0363 TaxID=3110244 RepID=UPI002B1EE1C0|nr:hypothetical protein [Rivularia sp. UHCC 0363]MEA5597913.1 hypothetical protein [Rivularia sp. UHCC 0363]
MKTQSQYLPTKLYQIQHIKREIQDLQKQLSEIDCEIGGIKQNVDNVEPNQLKNHFQEFLDRNDDSEAESVEDKEKLWGNYILVILLTFYLLVMSFL